MENAEPLTTERGAQELSVTVNEARKRFCPPVSKQTIYRMIYAQKLRVLDHDGVTRIPVTELQKFFGKVVVYKPRRQKTNP